MDERALNFLKNMAAGLKLSMRKSWGYRPLKPVVLITLTTLFNNVLSVCNRALAEARQRPLTTRRYMWKWNINYIRMDKAGTLLHCEQARNNDEHQRIGYWRQRCR